MSKLRAALSHAFALGPDPSVDIQVPQGLQRLCQAIVDRRLETVAIVMLESLSPISGLLAQPLHGLQQPLSMLAGWSSEELRAVAVGLEDRRMLRLVIETLVELASRRDAT
ncbi:MAG: hypothetical protein MUC50_16860 [Myxococcota bacterium]|jgi:hypothetical protein|nr:hypothetical protein [Myxococcota bacterium]